MRVILFAILAVCPGTLLAEGASTLKKHSENITKKRHSYEIKMDGSMDGVNTRDPIGYKNFAQAYEPNEFVRIENLGDDALINPWIVVNGKRDWRSLDAILDGILQEKMTDAQKARAIWEFARRQRFHFTTGDDEVKDTVKMLNVYGYTLCWDSAFTMSNLWQKAGLKVRRGYPHGHCTTEVFFDGRFHLMDSDEHLLILMRDNETIAGEEDVARDHDLMKRSHAYGILKAESRGAAEKTAALFMPTGPRTGGRKIIKGHGMNLRLRPGEALLWEWKDRNKYHGIWKRPPRLCNGRMQFTPDLTSKNYSKWTKDTQNFKATKDGLQLQKAGEALLSYQVSSPYVIVGGKLELTVRQAETVDGISLAFSSDNKTWKPIWTNKETGTLKETLLLDSFFPNNAPPCYEYFLRLSIKSANGSLKLERLFLESDLQMAPLSLPALETGSNQVVYTDETPGTRNVKLTLAWRERHDVVPPPAPASALFPKNGINVEGTRLTFKWQPVPEAADYHFELSAHADMRYPLSPVFEKLLSRTPTKGKAEWRIPYEGLLNPGQTYYWHVRSRHAEGLWGAWSPTWSFVPEAPGTPLKLSLKPDREKRSITLHWQANTNGQPVDHYEVYGSNERGFSISRKPYAVVMGRKKENATFPANLIGETKERFFPVVNQNLKKGNTTYYRVVSVDAKGNRSGPSDFVEAPHPFIYSTPPTHVSVGQVLNYQVKTLRSIGDLRCVTEGGRRYVSAFRGQDVMTFMLDEAPRWISLAEKTGILKVAPKAKDAGTGTHTITFRVSNGQGGVDGQSFDLKVVQSKTVKDNTSRK